MWLALRKIWKWKRRPRVEAVPDAAGWWWTEARHLCRYGKGPTESWHYRRGRLLCCRTWPKTIVSFSFIAKSASSDHFRNKSPCPRPEGQSGSGLRIHRRHSCWWLAFARLFWVFGQSTGHCLHRVKWNSHCFARSGKIAFGQPSCIFLTLTNS